jgi:hypothetical protein
MGMAAAAAAIYRLIIIYPETELCSFSATKIVICHLR